MSAPPDCIGALVERYDPAVFDARRRDTRIRLQVRGGGEWDVHIAGDTAVLEQPGGRHDALIAADARTWEAIAADVARGMDAYRAGRLAVRHNLHVGVGFLAATSGASGAGRMRFRTVPVKRARMSRMQVSLLEAGTGPAVLALHGLGATKGSFLPTVAGLADRYRVIAMDLPGFGDSDKPIGAAYDARFFADSAVALLDALGLERAHLIGNSLGGRIALEIGLRQPSRAGRLVLLATSLAWRRARPWVPLLRLMRPELGLVQVAPRRVVQTIVQRLIPGAEHGWTAAGVDEFLRAYLTPAGRAAFYAAARHIYLEDPDGDSGFWTRLRNLQPPSLFVWGRRDGLVPIAFARHVAEALPAAHHLELDCGHVPQIERPRQTNEAIAHFLAAGTATRVRAAGAPRRASVAGRGAR